jgi:hypothetical protein
LDDGVETLLQHVLHHPGTVVDLKNGVSYKGNRNCAASFRTLDQRAIIRVLIGDVTVVAPSLPL